MSLLNNKTSIPLGIITIKAEEDIAANRFVTVEGKYCKPSEKIIGVSMKSCKMGELIPVCISGVAVVEVEANITKGSEVRHGTDGKAISTPIAVQMLYALDSATAGSFIRVKL